MRREPPSLNKPINKAGYGPSLYEGMAARTFEEGCRYLREHLFDWSQRRTTRDQQITCVDMTPIAAWHGQARLEEIQELLEGTPVRPPFPVAMIGYLSYIPNRDHWLIGCLSVQRMEPGDERVPADAIDNGGLVISNWLAGEVRPVSFVYLRADGTVGSVPRIGEMPQPIEGYDISVVLIGLAMFHVRNIGLQPVPYPRYLRRRTRRDLSEEGPQVYHTLRLKPLVFSDFQGGQRMPTGDRPLHLVRGHFARYTKQRPLFGKYAGTFWRPEHEAGDKSIAVVRKTFGFNLDEEAS